MLYITVDGSATRETPTPFTHENLVTFETEYFSKSPNSFTNATGGLRYGQALENVFGFDTIYDKHIYNETDVRLCRTIAWLKIRDIKHVED